MCGTFKLDMKLRAIEHNFIPVLNHYLDDGELSKALIRLSGIVI